MKSNKQLLTVHEIYANGGRDARGRSARDIVENMERAAKYRIVSEHAHGRARGWLRRYIFEDIREFGKGLLSRDAWLINQLPEDCRPNEELIVPSDDTIERVLDAAEIAVETDQR